MQPRNKCQVEKLKSITKLVHTEIMCVSVCVLVCMKENFWEKDVGAREILSYERKFRNERLVVEKVNKQDERNKERITDQNQDKKKEGKNKKKLIIKVVEGEEKRKKNVNRAKNNQKIEKERKNEK